MKPSYECHPGPRTMNWQRIVLATRNASYVAPNQAMLTHLRYLLSDAELGGSGRFNRVPFIEHGTCLDTEIARMRATAASVYEVPVYPSFWLYGQPAEIKQPFVLSRTWIREIPGPRRDAQQFRAYAAHAGRPFVNSSLYWLTAFQVLEVATSQEAINAATVSGPHAFFPYRDQQAGNGFRLQ